MGKFILSYQQGAYTFTFRADNGEPVMTGLPHITKSAAILAIKELKEASRYAHLFARKEIDDQYYFELHNTAGHVLATSERCWAPNSRDYAMTIVKREMANAELTETM